MMYNVDYLVVDLRNTHKVRNDVEEVCVFIETLHLSKSVHLPLEGILIGK